jgi:hypothetical protein
MKLRSGWTLQRTHRNSRAAGAITLTDSLAFSAPQTFEVAITTLGNVRQPTANTLEFWQQAQVLGASIESSAPIALSAETIDEDGLRFQRIAIRFQALAANGWLRLTYQR